MRTSDYVDGGPLVESSLAHPCPMRTSDYVPFLTEFFTFPSVSNYYLAGIKRRIIPILIGHPFVLN